MNIKDVEFDIRKLPWRESKLTSAGEHHAAYGDLLATMFEGQLSLIAKYHDIEEANGTLVLDPEQFGQLDQREVQTRLKDLCWRMVEELGEAMNCLKNRPHKTTFVATDVEHYKEELADAFHYFMELLVSSGINADELFVLYFAKHAVNEFRQRSNY